MAVSHLERLEMIDYILVETDRETQGDFELDLLYDELENMTDIQVAGMAEDYGWK